MEIFGAWLASLFNMQYDDEFLRIANPIQYAVTALILFFISLARKMNKLKSS